jgi:hypothetical protein
VQLTGGHQDVEWKTRLPDFLLRLRLLDNPSTMVG